MENVQIGQDVDNPVAVDLLRKHIAAALPGWRLTHGSMNQINERLDDAKEGERILAVNDLVPFELDPLQTGATAVTFVVALVFLVKSGVADAPEVRIAYTREALRAARALMFQIQRKGEGLKLSGKATGRAFINAFDANLDGVDCALKLTAPADSFDYCAAPVEAAAEAPDVEGYKETYRESYGLI